MLKLQLMHNI